MDTLNNFERLRIATGGFQQSDVLDRFKNESHTSTTRKSQLIALRILKTIRKQGISQKQLSEQMNVSPQTISKWVKGKENFTLETIEKIEFALGIKLITIAEDKTVRSIAAIKHTAVYRPIAVAAIERRAKQRAGSSLRKQDFHSYNRSLPFA